MHQRPIQKALRHGRVQEAQQLLLLSGTNDAVHEPLCVYGVKVTPLLLAAQRGWFCMAKLLLEHGADGVPALFFAVLHGRTEMVKVLLKHGADITATDGEGHTALHCAVQLHAVECDYEDNREPQTTTSNLDRFPRIINGSTRLAGLIAAILEHGCVYSNYTILTTKTEFGETPEDIASVEDGVQEMLSSALMHAEAIRGPVVEAFVMGQHERLGMVSLVRTLPIEIARKILCYM